MTLPSFVQQLIQISNIFYNQKSNLKFTSRCCTKKKSLGPKSRDLVQFWGKLVHQPALPACLPAGVCFAFYLHLQSPWGLVISNSHPQNANLMVFFLCPCHLHHFWWVCHHVNLWKPTLIQWSLVLWYWLSNSTDFFIRFLFFSSLLLLIPAGYHWWKMIEILWLGKNSA